MTDRKNMLEHITELLGSQSTQDDAEVMFDALEDAGYLTFDPQSGFELEDVPEHIWISLLGGLT